MSSRANRDNYVSDEDLPQLMMNLEISDVLDKALENDDNIPINDDQNLKGFIRRILSTGVLNCVPLNDVDREEMKNDIDEYLNGDVPIEDKIYKFFDADKCGIREQIRSGIDEYEIALEKSREKEIDIDIEFEMDIAKFVLDKMSVVFDGVVDFDFNVPIEESDLLDFANFRYKYHRHLSIDSHARLFKNRLIIAEREGRLNEYIRGMMTEEYLKKFIQEILVTDPELKFHFPIVFELDSIACRGLRRLITQMGYSFIFFLGRYNFWMHNSKTLIKFEDQPYGNLVGDVNRLVKIFGIFIDIFCEHIYTSFKETVKGVKKMLFKPIVKVGARFVRKFLKRKLEGYHNKFLKNVVERLANTPYVNAGVLDFLETITYGLDQLSARISQTIEPQDNISLDIMINNFSWHYFKYADTILEYWNEYATILTTHGGHTDFRSFVEMKLLEE